MKTRYNYKLWTMTCKGGEKVGRIRNVGLGKENWWITNREHILNKPNPISLSKHFDIHAPSNHIKLSITERSVPYIYEFKIL